MCLRLGTVALVALAASGVAAATVRLLDQAAASPAGAATGTRAAPASPERRAAPPRRERRVTIAAVGDVVMGSVEAGLPPDDGAGVLAGARDALRGDLVIGNLEGVLADEGASKCPVPRAAKAGAPAAPRTCFAFRAPSAYARHLDEAGFTVMTLANNHAMDYGPAGLAATRAALAGRRIAAVGLPGQAAVARVRGVRVAVVGFAPYPFANDLRDPAWAAALIRALDRTADVVVVTMHAGAEGPDASRIAPGIERYLGEDRGDAMAFAHAVVDAGADLVIGHGPHVLRGAEVYRGRLIAYSLGNFAGPGALGTAGPLGESAVLSATLAGDGRFTEGRVHPMRLDGGVPEPGGDAVTTLRALGERDLGRRAVRVADDGALSSPRQPGAATTG